MIKRSGLWANVLLILITLSACGGGGGDNGGGGSGDNGGNPLIGSWQLIDDVDVNNIFILSFIDDNRYMIAEYDIDSSLTFMGAMEFGNYNFDTSSGAFTITGLIVESTRKSHCWSAEFHSQMIPCRLPSKSE